MAYGWNVVRVGDANDLTMLARAFQTFKNSQDRPNLIIVDNHIAFGSPKKQDTSAAHGEPLGEDEIKATKRNYGWPEDAKFLVPEGVYDHFRLGLGARGRVLREAWMAKFNDYKTKHPELADHLYKIYIFTHDSIGVGEDGPTHQPVEQLASLRAIPGLITLRPGAKWGFVFRRSSTSKRTASRPALSACLPGNCSKGNRKHTRTM